MASVERALQMLKNMPRVALNNTKDQLNPTKKKKLPRGQHGGNKCGRGDKGQGQHNTLPRLGFEGGQSPFYLIIPKEPYYAGHHIRRQYPPLSLLELQRMIDLGRINTDEPVDLTQICNTKLYKMKVDKRHYGINLTDEGADIFQAKVNIEVQWTNEVVIAAIERNGGVITTRYFDPHSLMALTDPENWFSTGKPIPRCKLPPQDAVGYYTDASNRGYLADPDKIREARAVTAQKFGYNIPDIRNDPQFELLIRRKDPGQIFHGLKPGWVVNLKDKTVLKPKDKIYEEYYKS